MVAAKLQKKKRKIMSPVHDCGSTCQTPPFLPFFLPAAIPDSQVRPEVLGGNQDNEDIKNIIPEPAATPPPATRLQPFDYDGEVYTGTETEEQPQAKFPEEEEREEEEEEAVDNQLSPRGDVFSEWDVFFLSPVCMGGPRANDKLTVDQHKYCFCVFVTRMYQNVGIYLMHPSFRRPLNTILNGRERLLIGFTS